MVLSLLSPASTSAMAEPVRCDDIGNRLLKNRIFRVRLRVRSRYAVLNGYRVTPDVAFGVAAHGLPGMQAHRDAHHGTGVGRGVITRPDHRFSSSAPVAAFQRVIASSPPSSTSSPAPPRSVSIRPVYRSEHRHCRRGPTSMLPTFTSCVPESVSSLSEPITFSIISRRGSSPSASPPLAVPVAQVDVHAHRGTRVGDGMSVCYFRGSCIAIVSHTWRCGLSAHRRQHRLRAGHRRRRRSGLSSPSPTKEGVIAVFRPEMDSAIICAGELVVHVSTHRCPRPRQQAGVPPL